MLCSCVVWRLFGRSHDIFLVLALHISSGRIPSNNPCTKHVIYFSFPNSYTKLCTTSPNYLGEMTCTWGKHSGIVIVEFFFFIPKDWKMLSNGFRISVPYSYITPNKISYAISLKKVYHWSVTSSYEGCEAEEHDIPIFSPTFPLFWSWSLFDNHFPLAASFSACFWAPKLNMLSRDNGEEPCNWR